MQMVGRNGSSEFYRYGFQGQEKDDEVKGPGNSVNYKYRMHDPRIGRFFAVDPLAPKYPSLSVYHFSHNSPIGTVEIEGLEGRRPPLPPSNVPFRRNVEEYKVNQAQVEADFRRESEHKITWEEAELVRTRQEMFHRFMQPVDPENPSMSPWGTGSRSGEFAYQATELISQTKTFREIEHRIYTSPDHVYSKTTGIYYVGDGVPQVGSLSINELQQQYEKEYQNILLRNEKIPYANITKEQFNELSTFEQMSRHLQATMELGPSPYKAVEMYYKELIDKGATEVVSEKIISNPTVNVKVGY